MTDVESGAHERKVTDMVLGIYVPYSLARDLYQKCGCGAQTMNNLGTPYWRG